jgi:phosphoribosylglycinamide formyltransferase-1
VVAVATNRPSCGGAAFARERAIPLGELSQRSFGSAEERDAAMLGFFMDHGVELVVDAGYDRIHSRGFVEAFHGRIINIHPSLLPDFAGGTKLEVAYFATVRAAREWLTRPATNPPIVLEKISTP